MEKMESVMLEQQESGTVSREKFASSSSYLSN